MSLTLRKGSNPYTRIIYLISAQGETNESDNKKYESENYLLTSLDKNQVEGSPGDNKRKLAHVEKIAWIKPIEGADNIELVGILGWVCITKKGEFKPDDTCIYFEIDSKLKETEWSEFLRPKHFKIKTMKLSKFKVISQGLALPISAIPELQGKELEIGQDVTDLLGVTYSVDEDNIRKSNTVNPNAKYNSMASRHQKLFKKKPFKWLMRRTWGRKLLFIFFGKKKDKPLVFPTHFEFVHKTDETRCLIGNTKIITNKGIFRIADIVNKKLDVKVLSYNEQTLKLEFKPIKSYQKYLLNEDLIEIEYPYLPGVYKKNRVICTADHSFYDGKKFKKASEVNIGDSLYFKDTYYDKNIMPVVYGMLLGDSAIKKDKRCIGNYNYSILTTQGEKQLEYLKFKQKLFGEKYFKIREGKSGYSSNKVYIANLITDHFISKEIKENCIVNDKKTVTKEWCDKLTPISLAFWYMDDGTLKHRSLEDPNSPNIILSTCGFSKEENELLIDCLKNKFDITSNLRKEKNKYWSIYITVEGTKKFLELITPYMTKSMRYKTLIDLENTPCVLENKTFDKQEGMLSVEITNVQKHKKYKHNKHVYDLEIEDNHNFFANNVLTHNCENIPWILEDKQPYIVTTKVDGTSSTYILERKNRNLIQKILRRPKFEFYVLSRNIRQMTPDQNCYHDDNVYWNMEFKYNIRDFLQSQLDANDKLTYVCLQGETAGVGVQGNPHKLKDTQFFGFNYIDSINGRWNSEKAKELCSRYGIQWVPVISNNYILPDTMEELKLQADGQCEVPGSSGLREGYVYRSLDGKSSFKNVSRKYLLKKGE